MKFSRVFDWLTDLFHDQFKRFATRSDYALGLIAIALFCMSLLSWKLLLAIAIGSTVAWVVSEIQQPNLVWFQRVYQALLQLWQVPTGKGVISGSAVTLLILGGFGLSDIIGRGWIAATLILQSFIGIGVFALWKQSTKINQQQSSSTTAFNCDRYINDLAHPTLMRRMIAVHRLQHWITAQAVSPSEIPELRAYFQVLLAQETNATMRLALQDALETCHHRCPALNRSSLADATVQAQDVSHSTRTHSLSTVHSFPL